VDEYIQSLNEDEITQDLKDYAFRLELLVNQDVMEEFQDIDLGGHFSGVDTRTMAIAVGMEREYKFYFAPSSSNIHGEWSIVDENVFTRCLNPLHRGHRILRSLDSDFSNLHFLTTVLSVAEQLLIEYKDSIGGQLGTRDGIEDQGS
jgi:hypothetical protein